MSDFYARQVTPWRFAAASSVLALAAFVALTLVVGCERRETTTAEAEREE